MTITNNDRRSASLLEVLGAATEGQSWAREELSARCLPDLRAFGTARGAIDAQGIADQVMMEFLARLDRLSFSTEGQMWAYLYRIARSRIIDERRSLRPVDYHENGAMEDLLPPIDGFDDLVAEQRYVDDLLSSLTDEQRQVLELRFLDDLSIEETAARTGRTLTAVKGLQRRALRALLSAAALVAVVVLGGYLLVRGAGNDGVPTVSEPPRPTLVVEPPFEQELGQSLPADDSTDVADTLPPESRIESVRYDETDPWTVTVEISAVDGQAGVEHLECRLDGGTFEPCTSPVVLENLGDGSHVFEVRAVDRAGNWQAAPDRIVWTIERPPGVPVGVDLAAMRSSKEKLSCGPLRGTWADLTEQGYDVMVGTPGDDVIDVSGGDRPDAVFGLGGNDTITTGSGADIVCAGDGNDTIQTGDGDDRVWAGKGNDSVDGGAGNDRLDGSAGQDSLEGDRGDDLLIGGDGTDVLAGEQGNDQLIGGPDHDRLDGGPDDDRCSPDERLENEPAPVTDETTSSVSDAPESSMAAGSTEACEGPVGP